jgi:hypothetical protein
LSADRRIFFRRLVLLSVLVFLAAGKPQGPPMFRTMMISVALALGACAVRTPVPTLDVAGDRLFVAATVNSVPVSALLDSAAEVSFADKSWAEKNGLAAAGSDIAKGTGGSADVSFVENVAVETLGTRLDGLTIAVLDLSDISVRLVGRPVNFILGREIFDQQRLAIDIEGGRISIARRNSAPDGVALPLTGDRGIETFEARVNGEAVSAEFDLGNGSDILIGKALAERLGLLDDPASLETRKGGGIGGEVDHKIVRLATLEFAGVTFSDVEAAVDETENAGELNIGVRLLRKFTIVTDFEQRTVWLQPRQR